ncbi:hypothetical protein D3C74_379580 [compost metagenome]
MANKKSQTYDLDVRIEEAEALEKELKEALATAAAKRKKLVKAREAYLAALVDDEEETEAPEETEKAAE